MTIIALGSVRFRVQPFNVHEYDHGHSSQFAEKPIMGGLMPLEWTGENPQTWKFAGRIFQHKFGGLDDLNRLFQMREAGRAVYLSRGDGRTLGWVVVESVTERSTYLDAKGVGKVIEFDIQVKQSEGPGAGSYYSVFSGLF